MNRISRGFAVLAAAISIALWAGCDQARAGKQSNNPTQETSQASVAVDARDQYDLVATLRQAEGMHPDDADQRYREIYRDFHGKRYRWTVHRIAALCPSAEQCNVLAFTPADRQERKILQGWMPRLELTEDAHATLARTCAGKDMCAFEFEGTMSRLIASTQNLTSVSFSDVHIR